MCVCVGRRWGGGGGGGVEEDRIKNARADIRLLCVQFFISCSELRRGPKSEVGPLGYRQNPSFQHPSVDGFKY